MASLGQYAGSELVEGSQSFDPIPAGVYDMEVVASDVVPTKNGKGTMLKLELVVTSGEYESRRVWANLNIVNESVKAQEIGQRQLSDLCRACGLAAVPGESEEFHGIPIRVNVGVETDPQYGAKNVVKRFLSDGDTAPAQPQPARQAAAAPRTNAAPANSSRPQPSWKRAG